MLLIFFFVCVVSGASGGDTASDAADIKAFNGAMEALFAMQSGVAPVSAHDASRRELSNLMRRQSVSQRLTELRALSDTDLFRMAQLAAVGGASRWKRDDASNLILLTKDGQMIHPYSPGAVESDVMMCVICALLTVIAIHHVVLQPTPPAAAPPLAAAPDSAGKQLGDKFAATILPT